LYCVPEHGNCHGMAGHMQAFYDMKMLRKVIKETLHIEKLEVPDMISKSVIIKLL